MWLVVAEEGEGEEEEAILMNELME